jgi:hypothetical protein
LKAVIDDQRVEVEEVLRQEASLSPMESELFHTIEEVVREYVPEAAVLPTVSPGFTDSRVFRRRGAVAYGFIPCLLKPAEIASAHGHNERISIESLASPVRDDSMSPGRGNNTSLALRRAKPEKIETIGVMGGGVMGGGIAQVLAVADYKIVLRDLTNELLDKTRATMVDGRFGLKASNAVFTADQTTSPDRVTFTTKA